MTLAATHDFITRYLRDPALRTRIDAEGLACLGLARPELSVIAEIDLRALRCAADHLEQERIAKRQNEFGPFLAQMGRYTELETFYKAYVQEFVEGDLLRRTELERFYHFAAKYLLLNDLPAYLFDLLKRQYHGITLAEDPVEYPSEPLCEGTIDLHHRVYLPRPWVRLSFGFDVISHAYPSTGSAPIEALIVRDLRRHKLTNIVPVARAGVLDAVSRLPAGSTVLAVLEHLQAFHRAGALVREIDEHRGNGVLLVTQRAGYLAKSRD